MKEKFYGSTTLGKKGQVVIPVEARNQLHWVEEDKLLVFGLKNGMAVLVKLEEVQHLSTEIEKKLKRVKKYIETIK